MPAALFPISRRVARRGAGSHSGGKGGPGGLLAGKELSGEGDGVTGLLEEQGLEEVSQQHSELGVLLNVGGVGRLQLLLW